MSAARGHGPGVRAHWRGRPLAAVLFDLDGTVLDTAGDIALALNRALGEQGRPALPVEAVRTMIGRGSPMLVRRAAAAGGMPLDEAGYSQLLARYFDHYAALECSAERTARPFDGAVAALRGLHAAGLAIAIVT
ncbi:MAG: HAD hydrolase-like protein, partial [Steroidobacteraceae bacterium]|nr:HAD hydrolase-like protein [Steroidobacteraceae bacterium]